MDIESLETKGLPVTTYMEQGQLFVKELGIQCVHTRIREEMEVCLDGSNYDVSKSFVDNLKGSEPNIRWTEHYSFMEGQEDLLLKSFCDGRLRVAMDGSHHPEWHLATAALCVVAHDDTCLTTVLQAPGREDDLQSHRAELSGHFAVVTILEYLKLWATREDKDISNAGAIVACDNKESLQLYNEDYFFDPTQADYDLLHSIQARIRELNVAVAGKWVKGHQDDRVAFDSLE